MNDFFRIIKNEFAANSYAKRFADDPLCHSLLWDRPLAPGTCCSICETLITKDAKYYLFPKDENGNREVRCDNCYNPNKSQ